MKVLSLHQPYASLVAMGHKRIETKVYNTDYRGEILIHAGSTKLSSSRFLTNRTFAEFIHHKTGVVFQGTGKVGSTPFDQLPFGAIIGKAYLCGTVPVGWLLGPGRENFIIGDGPYKGVDFALTQKELSFGDYSHDRTAYLLAGAKMFSEPIPAKGNASIWDYDL